MLNTQSLVNSGSMGLATQGIVPTTLPWSLGPWVTAPDHAELLAEMETLKRTQKEQSDLHPRPSAPTQALDGWRAPKEPSRKRLTEGQVELPRRCHVTPATPPATVRPGRCHPAAGPLPRQQ